jgi:hypothetical protein
MLIGTGGITPDLLVLQKENLTPKNHVIQEVGKSTYTSAARPQKDLFAVQWGRDLRQG